MCGSHTTEAYSSCDLTRVLYAFSRTFDILFVILPQTKPSVLFAPPTIRSAMWGFHDRPLEMSTPRYSAQVTVSRIWPCSVHIYDVLRGLQEPVICTTWHSEWLNSMSHLFFQVSSLSSSFWRVELSSSLLIVRYKEETHLRADLNRLVIDVNEE